MQFKWAWIAALTIFLRRFQLGSMRLDLFSRQTRARRLGDWKKFLYISDVNISFYGSSHPPLGGPKRQIKIYKITI